MAKFAVELGSGEKIPVIDFAGLTAADLAVRKATATSMREAFEDFGFIYLKNHSVPQSVVDELFTQGIEFFSLPAATKAEAGGYRGPGISALDPSKPTDVKERFRGPYNTNLPPGYWPEQLHTFARQFRLFMNGVCRYCGSSCTALRFRLDFRKSFSMRHMNRRLARCFCCTIRRSHSRYYPDSFGLERIRILGR